MDLTIFFIILGLAIASYLIGSVNFAIIITKKKTNTDIRTQGSGNAGVTNVLRTVGKKAAIATYLLDFLKGVTCAGLGRFGATALLCALCDKGVSFDPLIFAYIGGMFCMLGHIFPIFYGFHGGKGVASLSGVIAIVGGWPFWIAMALFIGFALATRIVSLSSLIAATSLPITTAIFSWDTTYTYKFLGMTSYAAGIVMSGVFALIVMLSHIPNIKRLIKGEENTFKKK